MQFPLLAIDAAPSIVGEPFIDASHLWLHSYCLENWLEVSIDTEQLQQPIESKCHSRLQSLEMQSADDLSARFHRRGTPGGRPEELRNDTIQRIDEVSAGTFETAIKQMNDFLELRIRSEIFNDANIDSHAFLPTSQISTPDA